MGSEKREISYPPIADYALISDCHCSALVSRYGSVDWSCMPRVDSDSCFGRLLDWCKGGYCLIAPVGDGGAASRRYLPGSMVLETRFKTEGGEVRLYDFFMMDTEADEHMRYEHMRLVEGISGEVEMRVEVRPRFDYGEILPAMRAHENQTFSAIGSNKGLLIRTDMALQVYGKHDLEGRITVREGERRRLQIHFEPPELIPQAVERCQHEKLSADAGLERTCAWWRKWSDSIHWPYELDDQSMRSAIVLKSLTYERTGAIIAAPTTSLPEWPGSSRNWDYRFSWVRDSVFTVRALHELGCQNEADHFLQFVQRSSAGSARQLQIMYGVDGKRRLSEINLGWLEGYRKSHPVRVGNLASKQLQLDVYGEIMEMAWEWRTGGREIDDHYWDFLVDVVDTTIDNWKNKDCGIWEFRGGPRHFVHSKAMCWSALNYGVKLAERYQRDAPLERWRQVRGDIRKAIESDGYDDKRGIFVQAFDNRYLDASLLLLPRIGLVDADDPRMLRTADAICRELDHGGLLRRYDSPDGLRGGEGVFLPCTFWLVSCLAAQGRVEPAWKYYRRATGCANELGLFSEEYDPKADEMLGNFPQGLTHVSQIMARLALDRAARAGAQR